MINTSILSLENSKEKSDYLLGIIGGSLLIALCAQIKIPLGFTPVPISLQTLAVMMIGGLLGRRQGTMSVCLYLAYVTLGLPVLAGGAANPLALIGANAGYLFGFALQAYLVGWCVEHQRGVRSGRMLLYVVVISILQMGMGALWLGLYVGMENALLMGFYPFLPGDILKCLAAVFFTSKINLQREAFGVR